MQQMQYTASSMRKEGREVFIVKQGSKVIKTVKDLASAKAEADKLNQQNGLPLLYAKR